MIGSSATTPALWAVISFSIFIASMMQSSWPSSTVSPCLTFTLHMLPCSGEGSVSPPTAPPPFLRSRGLRGAARPRPARDPFITNPPANGAPITLTSKRRPETSTV